MKEIKLTRGMVALVDDDDYALVSRYKWQYTRQNYARHDFRVGRGFGHVWMHRLIMNPPDGLQVDHINGNGLDNRRANLRLATASQNHHNRREERGKYSKYKGVSMIHHHNKTWKWTARITFEGKLQFLGTFPSEREAAIAYNNKASELFGEFALLNKID